MSIYTSLLQKVTDLTNAFNQQTLNSRSTDELPVATLPLDLADLVRVQQNGISRKVEVQELAGQSAPGKILFGSFQVYGHSGDAASTLVAGNIVSGWWSTTEFWVAARYNGGPVGTKSNFTILMPIEGL